MKQSIVTAIGPEAFGEEKLLLLFNQTASKNLKEYSIIQEWQTEEPVTIKSGDTLTLDNQSYQIDWVGPLANDNLNAIGHATLVFDAVPETDRIANALYLTPHKLPEIKIGTCITYQ